MGLQYMHLPIGSFSTGISWLLCDSASPFFPSPFSSLPVEASLEPPTKLILGAVVLTFFPVSVSYFFFSGSGILISGMGLPSFWCNFRV